MQVIQRGSHVLDAAFLASMSSEVKAPILGIGVDRSILGGHVAQLGARQAQALDPSNLKVRHSMLGVHCPSVLDREMPQDTNDDFAGDAKVSHRTISTMSDALDHGGVRDASMHVDLGIEEDLGVQDTIGVGDSEIVVRQ